jgi:sulfur carrier protein ThiS
MKIQINGEEREFADGLTVAGLLKEGDKVEIVHFVGGG